MADDIDEDDRGLPEYLEVEPRQFKIDVQLNKTQLLQLKLTNRTQAFVAFKVKTTAPKRYMVKPTQDYIPPLETKTCEIVLARMSEYPDTSNPKNLRDKFLVQSAVAEGEIVDLAKWWKDKEAEHKPREHKFAYHEYRLKCKLVVPTEKTNKSEFEPAIGQDDASTTSGATSKNTASPRQDNANILANIEPVPTPTFQMSPPLSAAVKVEEAPTKQFSNETATIPTVRLSYLENKERDYEELMKYCVGIATEKETIQKSLEDSRETNKKLQADKERLERELSATKATLEDTKKAVSDAELRHRKTTDESRAHNEPHDITKEDNKPANDKSVVRLQHYQLILLVFCCFSLGYFLA